MVTGDYTQIQHTIISLIKSQQLGEEGMHIDTICSMLHGKFSEYDVK